MADVVDAKTRSRMMAGIQGRNTEPERVVRAYLHAQGLRFRIHSPLPGKPDLVLRKHNTVVFVHGCFWHRHRSCRFATTPTTRAKFWQEKFAENVARDRRIQATLRRAGWRVLTVWECALAKQRRLATLARLHTQIVSG
jgi:DNA mismatch endonuclease (patch repair protein)